MPAPPKRVLTQKEKDEEAAKIVAARRAIVEKQREVEKKARAIAEKKAALVASGHVNVQAPRQSIRLDGENKAAFDYARTQRDNAIGAALMGLK